MSYEDEVLSFEDEEMQSKRKEMMKSDRLGYIMFTREKINNNAEKNYQKYQLAVEVTSC